MKDELDELNRIQHMTLKEKLEHTFDLLKNDPKLIAQFGDTLAEVFSPANIAFMVGGSATIAAALASPLAPFAAPPIAGFGYYLLGDAVFTVGKDVVNLLVYTLDAKTPEHFAKAVEAGERLIQAVVQKGAQAAVGGIFVKLAKSGKGKSNKPAKASTNEPSKPPSGGDGGHGNGGGSSGSGGSGSSGSGASGHGRGSGSSGSGSGSSGSGSPPSRAGGSGAPKDESPHAGGGGQKGNGSRAGKLFGLREWEVAPGSKPRLPRPSSSWRLNTSRTHGERPIVLMLTIRKAPLATSTPRRPNRLYSSERFGSAARAEELFHYRQLKARGLFGKTEDKIALDVNQEMETEVEGMLRNAGFQPKR